MNKVNLILPALFLLIFSSCERPSQDGKFMSVNGLLSSEQIGVTLSHEHVLVDWIGADSTGYHRWSRADVVERVLPFFLEAKENGVETIIEFTPAYLGRDPFVLLELSQQSGVKVLTNTGYYGAVDNRFMPGHAFEESTEEIAQRWIDEFNHGINGSELRPGFMKISVAEEVELSDFHQKIVNSAMLTHLETGMVIASHTIGDIPALEQIELLKAGGVSPEAWIWTHAQTGSLEGNMEAASEGAWIGLDNVTFNADQESDERGSIDWYANRINQLKEEGFLNRILISHDAGWYDPDEENGGDFRGYSDIFEYLLPALAELGFTEDEIHQLLVENPKQAFSLRVRTNQ